MFKPTSVFPAPGTPVKKHIDLCFSFLDFCIIALTASDVKLRLIALASLLDISETECPAYKAIAASIMVGVGLYLPFSQSVLIILSSSSSIKRT